MRTKSFTSSTCVTVHSLQGLLLLLLKAGDDGDSELPPLLLNFLLLKAGGDGDDELPPLLLNFLLLYTGDSLLLV
jgi:hypothetical protein